MSTSHSLSIISSTLSSLSPFRSLSFLPFFSLLPTRVLFLSPLSAGMPVDGEGRIGGEEGGVLDEVLGELYIFLMKESNMMLNMAYTNTIIERYCNTV
jgi:hypothetical protein